MKHRNYTKICTLAGFTLGILDGIRIAIIAYNKAPSMPGIYELLVQLGVILFLGFLYAFYGFLIGAVIKFSMTQIHKKKTKNLA